MANRPLKVFHGNYDGRREALVACTSMKRAAELIGTSLYDFRRYFLEVPPESEARSVALRNIETVFVRMMEPGTTWEPRT